MTKTVHIKSYGCQMNVYDAARMHEILAREGYRPVEAPAEADLLILNTCHIREKAAEKVYSELGRLKRLKGARERGHARPLIAVAGCVAQAEGPEIFARAPQVDLVFGPQAYHRLPRLLARAQTEAHVLDTEFPPEDKFAAMPGQRRARGPSAFLTIQEGCDKFCTFCVVPYTRGAEASRPVADVEREARALVADGAREIMLLGQNVNAYRGAGPDGVAWSLARLIRHLAEIFALDRLRYTTSHPKDMSEDLILAHRDVQKLMPYLHLPIQTGSDRILQAMNRRHTAKDYLRLVDKIRAARPDIALSSDFIVGFPGETERDFEATLALVRHIEFAHSFSFKYSPRPGTPGATMDGQIPLVVKAERLARLQALLTQQQRAFNAAHVGRPMQVLIDKRGRRAGIGLGRSPYLQPVEVEDARAAIGELIDVEIVDASAGGLRARPLAQRAAAE